MADVVYTNGKIYTVNEKQPVVDEVREVSDTSAGTIYELLVSFVVFADSAIDPLTFLAELQAANFTGLRSLSVKTNQLG